MRNTTFNYIDKGIEKNLRGIIQTNGEMAQLESTMYLLDGLLGWCEVCFNNDVEIKDHELLQKAYNLLAEVHKSYEENYN